MSIFTGEHIFLGIIQSYPVSCLNRDDNNDVKTADIGGAIRTVISSQCQKYAMMKECKARVSQLFSGVRTRLYPQTFANLLQKCGLDIDTAMEYADRFPVVLGAKSDPKKKSKTGKKDGVDDDAEEEESAESDNNGGINIFCDDELFLIAQKTVEARKDRLEKPDSEGKSSKVKKGEKEKIIDGDLQKAIKQITSNYDNLNNAINIALAGRMIAGAGARNLHVDGAMAVMHSYTVHETETRFDYFTAVDEISGESGAGMLGNTSCSSGVFYRAANIDLSLMRQLDPDAMKKGLAEAISSFIKASPVARQNSMLATTVPYYVFAAYIKGDRPWISSAFIKPLPQTETGYEEDAVVAFREDFEIYKKKYFSGEKIATYEVSRDTDLSLKGLVDGVLSNV